MVKCVGPPKIERLERDQDPHIKKEDHMGPDWIDLLASRDVDAACAY